MSKIRTDRIKYISQRVQISNTILSETFDSHSNVEHKEAARISRTRLNVIHDEIMKRMDFAIHDNYSVKNITITFTSQNRKIRILSSRI